jgi:hypothetical protein
MEEHRQRVYNKQVIRKIFGRKRKETGENWILRGIIF